MSFLTQLQTNEPPAAAAAVNAECGAGEEDEEERSKRERSSSNANSGGWSELSGYLRRLNSADYSRSKRFWFKFDEKERKLFYFRTKGEQCPLGYIEVLHETNFILVDDPDQQSVSSNCLSTRSSSPSRRFRVITGDNSLILEAPNQWVCFQWLNELQKRRRSASPTQTPVQSSSQPLFEHSHQQSLLNLPKVSVASLDEPSSPRKSSLSNENETYLKTRSSYETGSTAIFYDHLATPTELISPRNTQLSIPTRVDPLVRSASFSFSGPRKSFRAKIMNRLRHSSSSNAPGAENRPLFVCQKCVDSRNKLVMMSDDLNAIKVEQSANRDVVKLLQQQIELLNGEKTFLRQTLDERLPRLGPVSNDNEILELRRNLIAKECELSLAQIKQKNQENELAGLRINYENLVEQNERLRQQVEVLQESLVTKDQTVVALTNEIFNMQTTPSSCSPLKLPKQSNHAMADIASNEPAKAVVATAAVEIESLKDSLKAFEIQNELLNTEIIHLNDAKKEESKRSRQLELKCYEWEAKCCQVQSKLLSLLKEVKENIRVESELEASKRAGSGRPSLANNDAIISLVNRLLQESSLDIPLSWHMGNRPAHSEISPNSAVNRMNECDELGFTINRIDDDADAIEILQNRADNLALRSSELKDPEMVKLNAEWQATWDKFVTSLTYADTNTQSSLNTSSITGTGFITGSILKSSADFTQTQEFKSLLRTSVPQEYRGKIWQAMINLNPRLKTVRSKVEPNYYQNLLSGKQNSNNQKYSMLASKQIELDLLRTLPNNRHFETLQSDGISRLRRVLNAYAKHNPYVGYCQGMNRLAAVALLFMPEEEAFWCLVLIIEYILPPDYFTSNLLDAHVDQYVLRDLLSEKMPALHAHFEQHSVEISFFNWFLTCFIDNIPVNIYLRIWDAFLSEGSKVLFRFSLAILKYHEAGLLELKDSFSINQYLRCIGERTKNVRRLSHIAFHLLNPFPMQRVKTKRAHYRQVVLAELKKLDELRQNLPKRLVTNEDEQLSD